MKISPTTQSLDVEPLLLFDTDSTAGQRGILVSQVMNSSSDLRTQNSSSNNKEINQKKTSSCCVRFRSIFKCFKNKSKPEKSSEQKSKPIEIISSIRDKLLTNSDLLKTEGIFRISTASSNMKKAQETIDNHLTETEVDIFLECNLFKTYFKESLTLEDVKTINEIIIETTELTKELTKEIISALPANFICLLSLLPSIKQHEADNQMPESNMATIFAPHFSPYLKELDPNNKSEIEITLKCMRQLTVFFIKYNAFIESNRSNSLT